MPTRWGEKLVQKTGARRSERGWGSGPEFVMNVYVFLGSNIIYRLHIDYHFTQKLSRSATESQIFRFILNIVSMSALVRGGGGDNFLFKPSTLLAVGRPDCN